MSPALLVALVGAVLAVVAVVTARRPAQVLSLTGYLDGWRALHGDTDPRANAFVHGWLRIVYAVTRPLAVRGVMPDLVTLVAVWLGAVVLVLSLAGGGWAVLAGVLVVLTALLDGVDGCLAVLTDRTSPHGRTLDNAADRVVEGLWLASLVALGCPVRLALLAAVAVLALEGVRLAAGRLVTVTAAEKPTRVIVLAPALVGSAIDPVAATLGAAILVGLTLGGLTQLGVALRRPSPA